MNHLQALAEACDLSSLIDRSLLAGVVRSATSRKPFAQENGRSKTVANQAAPIAPEHVGT